MTFTEKHFVYDGINSRQYNLIIAHIDTEAIKSLSGSVETQNFFNRNTLENTIIGQKYDDGALEVDIEFISDKPLSRVEQRKIKKWLFNHTEYKKFYIDKNEDEELERINGEIKQCYVNCIFTSPEIIEYNGIYGYKAKMQLSSPFAFQDEIEIIKTNSNAGYGDTNTPLFVRVDVDTDIEGFIYPIITIDRATKSTTQTIDDFKSSIGNYKIKDSKQVISEKNSEIYSDDMYSWFKDTTTQKQYLIKDVDRNECIIINPLDDGETIENISGYILNSRNEIAEKQRTTSSNQVQNVLINVKDGKFIKLYDGVNYLKFDKNISKATIKYQNVRCIR